jgi:DNA ligase (NAD+)
MDIIKKLNKSKQPVVWEIIADLTQDELEEIINISAEYYYNTDKSLITDNLYDVLMDKLKETYPKSSVIKKIGAVIKGANVKLPYWMGSMNKLKTDEQIEKWTKTHRTEYVITDKLDGISCLLVVKNGSYRMYTRGDGQFGRDITHLYKIVNMNTHKLEKSTLKNIAIRGELIMSKKNFKLFAKEMANARNMVAGIVNSKPESVKIENAKRVDFVAYEIIEPSVAPTEQFNLLTKLGLNVVYSDIYKEFNLHSLDNILYKRKLKSDYEIDGIIISDNEKHSASVSGNPEHSFAYKGISQSANVKVLEVIWTPSKDGLIVPVIRYEKIKLSSVEMQKTTGFNAGFILKHKIGIGATITVIRSGDTIPYILGVVKPAKHPSLPENYKYKWDSKGVNVILDDMSNDKTVIIKRLSKFINNIGVDNISEGIVTRLVDAHYNTIFRIVRMKKTDFLRVDGIKDKLADKLYTNLQNSLKKLNVLTLAVASNLFGRGFGERKLKKIFDIYPSIVSKYDYSDNSEWYERIKSIEGFDDITTTQFLKCLPEFQEFYIKFTENTQIKKYEPIRKTEGKFKDMIIVFTGFRNKEWHEYIEKNGGKVSSSVSKNTSILIHNDGDISSSSYAKAKDLNVKIMSKSEFQKKYF